MNKLWPRVSREVPRYGWPQAVEAPRTRAPRFGSAEFTDLFPLLQSGGLLSGSSYLIYRSLRDWAYVNKTIQSGRAERSGQGVRVEENPLQRLAQDLINNPWQAHQQFTKIFGYNSPHAKVLNRYLAQIKGSFEHTAWQPAFFTGDPKTKQKMMVEALGIFPGKLAQSLAGNENLPPSVQNILSRLKSQGTPTRNLKEAQSDVDTLYGKGKYKLSKLLGVGTVGEVFLAQRRDGQEVVIKLIKRGVTLDKLQVEKDVFASVIAVASQNDSQKAFLKNSLDLLQQGILQELDFRNEAASAHALAQSGQRYRVAKPLELGFSTAVGDKRATSVVYEKAPGVQLDQLMLMLIQYRKSPAAYAKTYAGEIARHPWLANPKAWMQELAPVYIQAFNEQALAVMRRQLKTVHGDPHPGNVFIDRDQGKLKLTYIDTGLTFTRTPEDIIEQIAFTLEFLFGLSNALARRIMKESDAKPEHLSDEALQKLLAKKLNQNLFQAVFDPNDPASMFLALSKSVEEAGIIQSPRKTLFYKAQGIVFEVYNELCRLTDLAGNPMKETSRDLFGGFANALVANPKLMIRAMRNIAGEVRRNTEQSIRTADFFILSMKNAPKKGAK